MPDSVKGLAEIQDNDDDACGLVDRIKVEKLCGGCMYISVAVVEPDGRKKQTGLRR